jgi:uncharacterized protein YndB with AHSA1/START domain
MSFLAKAEVDVNASATAVWKALTDPEQISKYFFGSQVQTDWRPGSPIQWKGEFNGRSYVDRGEILRVENNRLLSMTHFSPMSGQPDEPQNYHTLTYELSESGGATHVSLVQDNNATEEEAEHSSKNWQTMLDGLKKTVEGQ